MTLKTNGTMMTNDELISIYMDRFINRSDIWGRQWASHDGERHGYAHQSPSMDTKDGRYPYRAITPYLVHEHFMGSITCAWSAIDEHGSSKWLCFDSDSQDGSLDVLEQFLCQYNWKVIREGRRPGRDGHLWLLFDKSAPAIDLIIAGTAMLEFAGVKGIELFPKTAGGYSQVRGPLGINQKPSAGRVRGLFDKVETNLRRQLEWLALQPLNRADDVVREAELHRPRPTKRSPIKRRFRAKKKTFRILDRVNARPRGKELVAACPCCVDEGHDKHRDNLRIKMDGSEFCCVYGGPNQVHKVCDIVATLSTVYLR